MRTYLNQTKIRVPLWILDCPKKLKNTGKFPKKPITKREKLRTNNTSSFPIHLAKIAQKLWTLAIHSRYGIERPFRLEEDTMCSVGCFPLYDENFWLRIKECKNIGFNKFLITIWVSKSAKNYTQNSIALHKRPPKMNTSEKPIWKIKSAVKRALLVKQTTQIWVQPQLLDGLTSICILV